MRFQPYVHLDWTASLSRLVIAGIVFSTLAMSAVSVMADPVPTYMDNFKKIVEKPVSLIDFLQRARLSEEIGKASPQVPESLRKAGFEVVEKPPGTDIRLGGKVVPVKGHVCWKHFETSDQRPWIDIVEFESKEACKAVFKKKGQWHSGAPRSDSFRFIAIKKDNGLDAVSVIVKRDRYLFNFGFAIPFKIRTPDEGANSPKELKYINASIDSLALVMEATARALVDPEAITWIPPAMPDEDEVRLMRLAAFSRLWSEVKYNFAFLENRPNLDWDRVLELYLPRIDAARTQEEYLRILQECIALLQDGHTWVRGGSSGDTPLVNIELVGEKPVVTAVGDTPEMQASGIRPGMELIEVNGVPVDQLLEQEIYPYIFASTPQDRNVKAFRRLLEAEPGSTISAMFLDMKGGRHTAKLVCNLSKHRDAASWARRPAPFEYRELPDGIVYVAVNTFGSDKVVKAFDDEFEKILGSKGLIIDVRNNSGGSTGNGYAIIARLIDKPSEQTSMWRSREYKPVFRSWGREQEWYEGEHGTIEPRGDRPYLGPVVVLTGPKTYSAAEDFLVPLKASGRATLIGEPTGGSTGQPLFVEVYGASVGICTKWDRFPDGTEFVGVGVQPDIPVQRTKQDVVRGTDPVLERAVAFLKQK